MGHEVRQPGVKRTVFVSSIYNRLMSSYVLTQYMVAVWAVYGDVNGRYGRQHAPRPPATLLVGRTEQLVVIWGREGRGRVEGG